MEITIAGLAHKGNVGVETVRYYQRRGLLRRPKTTPSSSIRRYNDGDVRRLRFIRSAQAAGFTLEQITELLALDSTNDRARASSLAKERIAALSEKISELEAARAALKRLDRACRANSRGPCPILKAFEDS